MGAWYILAPHLAEGYLHPPALYPARSMCGYIAALRHQLKVGKEPTRKIGQRQMFQHMQLLKSPSIIQTLQSDGPLRAIFSLLHQSAIDGW